LQAVVAGVEPDYRMNSFTPKPLGNGEFELILEGNVIERFRMSPLMFLKEVFKGAAGVDVFFNRIMDSVKRCLYYLMDKYDVVCIEGSGPSKLRGLGYFSKLLDIPNMETAKLASALVILLKSSIDSAVATYHHLPKGERDFVKGVIINRLQQRSLEKEIVEEMGVPRGVFERGVRWVKKEWLKGLSMPVEILGEIPYLEKLSKIPPLDPLFSEKEVELDLWKHMVPKIAEKVSGKVKIKEIYRMIGL